MKRTTHIFKAQSREELEKLMKEKEKSNFVQISEITERFNDYHGRMMYYVKMRLEKPPL